ncbi:hypothetical protein M5K25_001692 [Dendrobium thyrsiflorum]|uniref:Uncharacterized protein n=1 Tax=Dendrobium thyrsiflorum TaxID=117978 RepID=A0ABD0W209_DENTH
MGIGSWIFGGGRKRLKSGSSANKEDDSQCTDLSLKMELSSVVSLPFWLSPKRTVLAISDINSNVEIDLQNTAFTVQLGRGTRIQLANAIIEIENDGATIQFDSLDLP